MIRFTPLAAGYMGGAIISIGILLYLFTLKRSRRELLFLKGFYVSATMMFVSFTVRYSVYASSTLVYGTGIATDIIVLGLASFVLFVYTVHENPYVKESIAVSVVFFASSLVLMIWNASRFAELERIYIFEINAHYLDFATGPAFGVLLVAECAWAIVVAVRKSRRKSLPRRAARSMRGFALLSGLLLATTITFALYEVGLLSRELFDQLFGMGALIMTFLMFVTYVTSAGIQSGVNIRLVGYPVVGIVLVVGLTGFAVTQSQGAAALRTMRHEAQVISEISGRMEGLEIPDSGMVLPGDVRVARALPDFAYRESVRDGVVFGYQNVDALSSYRIAVFAGGLWVSFPYDGFRTLLHESAGLVVLLMVASTAALLVVLPLLYRASITRPVAKLMLGVSTLRRGEMPSAIRVDYDDEIGAITHQINNLVATLEAAHETFKTTVDSSSDMILLYSDFGRELHRNGPAAALPDSLGMLSDGAILTDTDTSIEAAVMAGAPFRSGDARVEDTHGRTLRLDVATTPVLWRGVGAVMLHMSDISGKLVQEAREEQLLSILARSDRLASLGMLLATVSHDIQTPLHTLGLAGAYLRDFMGRVSEAEVPADTRIGPLPFSKALGVADEQTRSIESAVKLISQITAELRRYVEEGQQEQESLFDISQSVRRVYHSVRRYVEGYTDNFQFVLPGELPRLVGRETRIQQVVLNLVRNACDALPHRNSAIELSTGYDHDSDEITIAVRDEGVGIPKELHDKIFEPFVTYRSGATGSLGPRSGSGMGLAICHEIVSLHNGRIEVQSKEGVGSTFTIFLPRNIDRARTFVPGDAVPADQNPRL